MGHIVIGNLYTLVVLMDRGDLAVQRNQVMHLPVEALADHVHATHRLEHGGLHVETFMEGKPRPQAGAHDIRAGKWRGRNGRAIYAATRCLFVATGFGTDGAPGVIQPGIETAPLPHGGHDMFMFIGRDHVIKLVLVNRLAQQFRRKAMEIRGEFPVPDRFAIKRPARMEHELWFSSTNGSSSTPNSRQ